jgi:AcrR family transcriptional regulator
MQQRSEETRSHILEAALQEFSRHGYEGTGVAEICEAAGVSKGAFYHHFPSKQDVFLVLLEDWLSGLDAAFAKALAGAEDVPAGLMRMAKMVPEIYKAAEGRLTMFLEFWMQASRNPAVWEVTIAPYHRYQKLFAEIIRKGIAEGSLRDTDPDVTARVLVALAVGLLLQGVLDPQGTAWEEVTLQGLELLIHGISRR